MQNSSKRETQPQPDQFDRDLHPTGAAGQNERAPADAEVGMRTAYDVKPLHRALNGISDDVLREVPVLPEGTRLQQGATYLNLSDPTDGEFTATGDMQVGPGDAYVPKAEVPYTAYNLLRGISDPERTT